MMNDLAEPHPKVGCTFASKEKRSLGKRAKVLARDRNWFGFVWLQWEDSGRKSRMGIWNFRYRFSLVAP
jgi:hypothetical protein